MRLFMSIELPEPVAAALDAWPERIGRQMGPDDAARFASTNLFATSPVPDPIVLQIVQRHQK